MVTQTVPKSRCQLADYHSSGYKTATEASAACEILTEMWWVARILVKNLTSQR